MSVERLKDIAPPDWRSRDKTPIYCIYTKCWSQARFRQTLSFLLSYMEKPSSKAQTIQHADEALLASLGYKQVSENDSAALL